MTCFILICVVRDIKKISQNYVVGQMENLKMIQIENDHMFVFIGTSRMWVERHKKMSHPTW